MNEVWSLKPIGLVRSPLLSRDGAPKQGSEGAPDAWLEFESALAPALEGLEVGHAVIVLTWLHQARRDLVQVHPRGDQRTSLTGVFATRSPDRPNPIGLHRVRILEIAGTRLKVGPLEAIDGTPIIDLKPVLAAVADS